MPGETFKPFVERINAVAKSGPRSLGIILAEVSRPDMALRPTLDSFMPGETFKPFVERTNAVAKSGPRSLGIILAEASRPDMALRPTLNSFMPGETFKPFVERINAVAKSGPQSLGIILAEASRPDMALRPTLDSFMPGETFKPFVERINAVAKSGPQSLGIILAEASRPDMALRPTLNSFMPGETFKPFVERINAVAKSGPRSLGIILAEASRPDMALRPTLDSFMPGETFKPFVEQINAVAKLGPQSLGNILAAVSRPDTALNSMLDRFNRIVPSSTPISQSIPLNFNFRDAARQTGWLCYHGIPIENLECYGRDATRNDRYISDYYQSFWPIIRQDIEQQLESCSLLDEESKKAFREALVAHEIGHYLSVPRVLFPEFENIFRKILNFNGTGQIFSNKLKEKLFDSGGSSWFFIVESSFDVELKNKFRSHLYEKVTARNIKNFEGSSIPNRHAVIHALVKYATIKDSINALILAEYILRSLNQFHKNQIN